jgi:hypothetical protein
MRRIIVLMTVVTLLVLSANFVLAEESTAPAAKSPDDTWQFAITPYLWAPNVDGTLKYEIPPGGGGSPEVEVGPNDYLENLNLAIMVSGEMRKGRSSLFTDVIYLDFSDEESTVKAVDFFDRGDNPVSSNLDSGTESSLEGLAWALGYSHEVWKGEHGRLETLGGVRYLRIEASTDWSLKSTVNAPGGGSVFQRTGNISRSDDLWDGVIGLRGRLNLGGSKFYIPYYIDIGMGTSELTWEGMVGLGYGFKWIDIIAAYRHLYYDMDDEGLIQELQFSGPAMGLTFRF